MPARLPRLAAVVALVVTAAGADADDAGAAKGAQAVAIYGYAGWAMEPFVTRDGRYLLFNDSNVAGRDTDLQYAERVDDTTFRYRGELTGANAAAGARA